MVDKTSVLQILGCLMKHPQYLSESDKYNLTLTDFYYSIDKYLFVAIENLYKNGAKRIQPIDVENYIETNIAARAAFNEKNGIEYLQDAIFLSEEDNFQYYYNRLKKINLLNSYKKRGVDIKQFYIEDLMDEKASEINANFESLTIPGIISAMKKKIFEVEKDFIQNDVTETRSIFEGIEEILEDAENKTDVGFPIQGDIFNEVIAGARLKTLLIRSASSGLGKAIPNDILIPTPKGWKMVGEIKEGDYLIGQDGKPTKVLKIHPQPVQKEVYEVKLKDGRIAKCCDEHLWEFQYKSHDGWKTKTANLQYLLEKQKTIGLQDSGGLYRFRIPMNEKVEYEEKEFKVHPYAMGAILGDGCLREGKKNRSLEFSSNEEEIVKHIAELMEWDYKKSKSNNYSWYFEIEPELKDGHWVKRIQIAETFNEYPSLINADSYTKFIPKDYLLGSIEQRTQLLQGLLDTDGSIDKKGRITYTTVSEQLRKDVIELCQSLGFIATYCTSLGEKYTQKRIFNITIQADCKSKANMFFLQRKKERAKISAEQKIRREDKKFLPIINIIKTGTYTDMTCFTVDNESHLFLMNDYIVTHNTRQAVGDACYIAFPFRYDNQKEEWVQEGGCQKTLFIATEQDFKDIQKMCLAYLTGFNETKFRYGDFSNKEKKILRQALWIMEKYKDNLHVVRMPNPTIELVKSIIRENVLMKEVEYIFYDYIFIGPSLLNEFRGFNLRNDEILLMFATALKDMAVEQNVFIMTSTQVNASADDNKNIRNESSLAGGRSTINKADTGAIMARPTKEEIDTLKMVIESIGIVPNVVTDIFKVRSGEWTEVRIWSDVNLGNLRKRDLFITDSRLNVIEDFNQSYKYETNWEEEEENELLEVLTQLKEVA